MARKFAAIYGSEAATRGRVAVLLSRQGWRTASATDGSRAGGEVDPDLYVADLTGSDTDPGVIISRMPTSEGTAPLLVVAECRFVRTHGDALDALRERWSGPIDFVYPPYEQDELKQRMHWLTCGEKRAPARVSEKAHMTYRYGPLSVDTGKWRARLQDSPLLVEQPQFLILVELIRAQGSVVPRSRLIEAVGHDPRAYSEGAVRSHVSRLKDALEAAGADRRCIRNLYGRGYALDEALLVGRG